MEGVKAWFSCFAIKGTNDLSAVNCFVIAISFLVDFPISHNGFGLDLSIEIFQLLCCCCFNLDYLWQVQIDFFI